jgi:hypothetical protein
MGYDDGNVGIPMMIDERETRETRETIREIGYVCMLEVE